MEPELKKSNLPPHSHSSECKHAATPVLFQKADGTRQMFGFVWSEMSEWKCGLRRRKWRRIGVSEEVGWVKRLWRWVGWLSSQWGNGLQVTTRLPLGHLWWVSGYTLTFYTCLCSNRELHKHMHGTGEAGCCEAWSRAQVFLLLCVLCAREMGASSSSKDV